MKDNYILGINFLHSDTSACIFKNGKLIAAAEEERFTRVKHTSAFPINSIYFCLEEAKIQIDQISKVTLNSNPFNALGRKVLFTLKNINRLKLGFNSLANVKKKININKYFSNLYPNKNKKLKFDYIDHHEAHIASSYYYSNFDESVNVSLDGFGDFVSCAWGSATKNKKKLIDKKIYFPHSLGIFYQALTQFLGFKKYGDEYKVMGLSSYGDPKYVNEISNLIYNTNEGFELNLEYFIHHKDKIIISKKNNQIEYKNLYSLKIYDLLGKERENNQKISKKDMDIAKSAQLVYENILFNLLNKLYDKYKIKNLTLSGGCAMNSVANGKILKNTPFEKLYISPNPGDAGGSVGSVLVSLNNSNKKIHHINNYAYLGKEYSNENIQEAILKKKLSNNFTVSNHDQDKLLNLITQNLINSKIIGWFQGRMEWGPRALGNRSIIADARNPKIKDIINLKIKRRENFRPFAPSILKEHVKEWFNEEIDVPYMSQVYSIKNEKKNQLPGITHVDGTGRLQTVSKSENSLYYYLIENFYKKTGIPIILNTSFNENEPIVLSPEHALDCFLRTNMDMLVMGNWVVMR